MTESGRALLEHVWRTLGRDHGELSLVERAPHPVPLPARTDVAGLSWASVTAASLTAARLAGAARVRCDPEAIAISYASERHFRLDGERPDAFAPLSGFFRTADGWVRTHGNYPHHAEALRRALGVSADAGRDRVEAALAATSAVGAASAITKAGGLCVVVAPEDPAADSALRRTPLIDTRMLRGGPAHPFTFDPRAPLRGIRVLDLTRVIAGPVATRTLALWGADVLRVDPPTLPEIGWQHLDSGHGKRTAVVDARSDTFAELLAAADVVVLGYRPRALDDLGLAPERLAADAGPGGIVVGRLSAWGSDSGADRRGFDSLVQAASGIAWIESADTSTPGALPAQALDHSAGYLLAAGITSALARRAHEGGSWLVETSLRRIAAQLLGMPRTARPEPAASHADPGAHLQTFAVAASEVTTTAPAVAYDGAPGRYAAPRTWGSDSPEWLPRERTI
ncbi:CoA transferase [Microbacterium awajiense]|uniref:CoA transferase n=1 Tax=Microbacterium awajiense TaxID=415214 RepID=A0ABP6ZZF8_9MICO